MDEPLLGGKKLPNEKYIVRKIITNKTQISHRIRFRNYTTVTPLENIHTKEKLRADDNIVIPQDDLYSMAWEAEANPSVSEQPEK